MEPRGSAGDSLPLVRTVGFVSVVMWVLAAALYIGLSTSRSPEPAPPMAAGIPSSGEVTGHLLRIAVRRSTTLRVVLDGAVVLDRRVEPREELAWEGAHRFVVEGAAPEALRIDWNGRRVTPLGRQDEPRRLVFVDDAEERR